jgi:hypothetical protein
MSALTAYCPQCRKETEFFEAGGARQCSVCGTQFRHTHGRPDSSAFGDAVVSIGKVLLTVILIMAGIVVVGVGVLFAGCALMMGGGHIGL